MAGLYSKVIKPIHFAGDLVIINVAYLAAFLFVFKDFDRFFAEDYLGYQLYFNMAWIVTVYLQNVYKFYRVTAFLKIFLNFARFFLFYAILVIAFKGLATDLGYSRLHLMYSLIFIFFGITLWRLIIYIALRTYRRSGHNYRRVVIAGFNDAAHDLVDFFSSHPEHGYKFLGIFDDDVTGHEGIKGRLSDVEKYCSENNVDEIYCIMSRLVPEQLNNLLDVADNNFIRIKLVPGLMDYSYKNLKLDLYDYLPVIAVRSNPLDEGENKFIKRTFDIVFSLLVCVLILSWLLPILAILIKLDSKGPVFFKQKRSGLNNKEFTCWKLRSMVVNNEAHTKQATEGDARITRIGRFIRKTNLDEFPQFFNVLIGNMSIVGPRPHMLKHTEEYSKIIEKFMLRHFIKPGITGLSQAVGLRGETTNPLMMKRRVKTDLFYIENWSFFLDIRIILLTVVNIFRGNKNAV